MPTPTALTSSDGATLTRLPDGSILSEGKRPERDTEVAMGKKGYQSACELPAPDPMKYM